MVITGSDFASIIEVKSHLFHEFEMKDLVYLRCFLGIEVASSPKGYLLSQTKYVTDILQRANVIDAKVVDTPLELHAKFNPSDGVTLDDPTQYPELVGCLVYLTVICPDIAYAVHIISLFVSTPQSIHWAALFCMLLYVRYTIYQCLLLSSTSSLTLRAYADCAGDVSNRKSTSGVFFLVIHLSPGKARNNMLLLDLLLKLNTMLWLLASAIAEIVWLR